MTLPPAAWLVGNYEEIQHVKSRNLRTGENDKAVECGDVGVGHRWAWAGVFASGGYVKLSGSVGWRR
jgi:hypothetical protein